MLYNSLGFAVFLAVTAIGYYFSPITRRPGVLLLASYVFYCTWSISFAALLLVATGVAYYVARWIGGTEDAGVRLWCVRLGVVTLLLPLAAFKYLAGVDALVGGWLGRSTWGGELVVQFAGAVGISYYTLKLVSYVVDVYWQRIEPCQRFGSLAAYAAFFPQILCGPIQRAGGFLEQIEQIRSPRPAVVISGLRLILFGLFKKLVLADRLGIIVDQVFAQPDAFSAGVAALGMYLFTIQLYADFSGLSDIAIGIGRLLGILAPPNFDSPLYAENVQEFWRRWHMSLTAWLVDYVFTPLRMMLRDWGQFGLVVSLAANMMAVGIWHGARMTFVVFGVIQAVYISCSALTLRSRTRALRNYPVWRRLHAIVGPLATFHLIVLSFVLIRAETLTTAWQLVARAASGVLRLPVAAQSGAAIGGFGALDWGLPDLAVAVWALVTMEVIHILRRRHQLSRLVGRMPGWVRWIGYGALGFAILLWGETESKQFIYVQF